MDTDFTDEQGNRLSERELRELAAYADGSLDAKRGAEVARRIAQSPAIAQFVGDQVSAVDAVRAANVSAPVALRAAIESQRPAQRARLRLPRPRIALAAPLATAVAALAIALAVALGGGSGPSVAQAAQLADRGSALPAPAQDSNNRQMLVSSVDGLHYPYWEDAFGWRARGARADTLGGRDAVTVYYSDSASHSIAYTIVGGSSLASPGGATHTVWRGTRFAVLTVGSRTVVTWLRHGHTCVLSSVNVPSATMVKLAAWQGTAGALAAWSSQVA